METMCVYFPHKLGWLVVENTNHRFGASCFECLILETRLITEMAESSDGCQHNLLINHE